MWDAAYKRSLDINQTSSPWIVKVSTCLSTLKPQILPGEMTKLDKEIKLIKQTHLFITLFVTVDRQEHMFNIFNIALSTFLKTPSGLMRLINQHIQHIAINGGQ